MSAEHKTIYCRSPKSCTGYAQHRTSLSPPARACLLFRHWSKRDSPKNFDMLMLGELSPFRLQSVVDCLVIEAFSVDRFYMLSILLIFHESRSNPGLLPPSPQDPSVRKNERMLYRNRRPMYRAGTGSATASLHVIDPLVIRT
jgi:hypothetical protein